MAAVDLIPTPRSGSPCLASLVSPTLPSHRWFLLALPRLARITTGTAHQRRSRATAISIRLSLSHLTTCWLLCPRRQTVDAKRSYMAAVEIGCPDEVVVR